MDIRIGDDVENPGVEERPLARKPAHASPAPSMTDAAIRPVPLAMRLGGEAVSIVAMALATLSLGIGLAVHGGLAPWAAASAAIAAYICMLALHAMMPRHFEVPAELAVPSPGERPLRAADPVEGATWAAPRAPPPPRRVPEVAFGGPPGAATGQGPALDPSLVHGPGLASSPLPAHGRGPVSSPAPVHGQAGVAPPSDVQLPLGRPPVATPPPMWGAMADPYGGPGQAVARPAAATATERRASAEPAEPPPGLVRTPPPFNSASPEPAAMVRPGRPSGAAPLSGLAAAGATSEARTGAGRARPPREADVEMIQGLIKKLADEVNAAAARPSGQADEVSERAITQSVDALRTTAGSMRAQDSRIQHTRAGGVAAQGPQPPRAAGAPAEPSGERTESGRPARVNARLSALAEALALNRLDVLLDPIVDFNAGRPRHFEVLLRLRDADGNVLDTRDVAEELSGTGMLARLDGSRAEHATQVAVRFGQRAEALFSSVSGEALGNSQFLDGIVDSYREREDVAGQLIMTFTQADVRSFGKREWQALVDFATLGFRYGVSEVTDLDMDFEDLKAKGFAFVKLDAGVFLEGLAAGGETFVAASDICRHLGELGFAVIVGRMQDERMAAKVFGFGVLFGQGTLFGGPKAVKRELFAGAKSGGAAA